ncbi:MAG TPA: prolyl oligopeptidase family serine peptidase [Thermoanaerobaculia bacterium]|nr:prolyl oligopeptidase family serine peptidase [Thermoanaerobaculia bacterium]
MLLPFHRLLPVVLLAALPSAAQTPAPASDPIEASVAALMKVGGATSPSFSPDGKRLAFVSDASGQPQVWIVAAEGGAPVPLIRTEDPAGPVAWSPDGSRIAYLLAPGGGMNTQVWIVNPDGSDPKRITDGGNETNLLGPFREDGKSLAVASNRRLRKHIDAWIWDAGTGSLSLAAQNRGSGGLLDFSRDGKTLLLLRSPQRGHSDLTLVDATTKAETPLTPHEGPARYQGRLAPDGKSVYVATNAGREMTAFGRIDLAEGKPGPFQVLAARDDAELSTFVIDEAGTRAVLLWNAAGRSELGFYDLKKRALAPGPALPGEIAEGLSLSRDGTKLAVSLSGPTRPSDLWVLDLKTGRFVQITKSAHDGVDLSALVKPERVKITAFDGKPLWSWLYRAKRAKGPGPLVLSFHEDPEGEEMPSYRADYQALLAQGISVLAPNVRGSSGFGRTFLALDDQARRVDVMRDVKACRDWVVEKKIADPARVGIMGRGYGGWITVAALTAYPVDFAAGADLSGIVSLLGFFENTEPWVAEISKAEYGDPQKQAELLKNLSPVLKANFVKAPVLVLHGRNDTIVPSLEAAQLVERLNARKIPVEYVLLPDEGHFFRKLPNRIRAGALLVHWFDKYLKAAGTQ